MCEYRVQNNKNSLIDHFYFLLNIYIEFLKVLLSPKEALSQHGWTNWMLR